MKGIKGAAVALALGAGIVFATPSQAADPAEGQPAPKAGQGPMMRGPHHPMHEEMWQQMRAHDAKLDELVDVMNKATGQARVDAIAAVVNELVAQRRSMRAHHDQMRKKARENTGSEGAAKP